MQNRTIYIIAELRKGCITQETYELMSFARAVWRGKNPVFLLLGKNVEEQAREIAKKTGCDALVLMGDHLELYNPLSYAHALMEILQEQVEAWVCMPHTSMGYDLAPRLAVLLKAACITGVESMQRRFTEAAYPFRSIHRRDCTEHSPGGGDRPSRGITVLVKKRPALPAR